MSRVNLKSLTFYGVMTGLVLVLFNGVTAYGERNLKAPSKISGDYLINAQNLPECLQSEKITLTIAQSGIYVAGKLSFSSNIEKPDKPLESNKASQSGSVSAALTDQKAIKLHGLMQSQPFTLTGNTNQLGACQSDDPKSNLPLTLQLQPQGKNLSGQLNWSALTLDFKSQRQEPVALDH